MRTIGTHYRVVEEALGRGESAEVHRVVDVRSGREVALKHLLLGPDDEERENESALFAREYFTLAQLDHPHIIKVYDYGVDAGRPYYTMELLRGTHLHELGRVPWRKACALLRDVASALSLLHSRRLLHRDLSTHNVRCDQDGRAKLIDFGTMVPMGVAEDTAGTPPFVAPEALRGEALDARADLYAFGALAYFVLTARHAYPAGHLLDLPGLWRSRPRELQHFDGSIPRPLGELVLALLSLDRTRRPTNAAEVVERLSAIAGLPPPHGHELRQAYLSAPKLVGRERVLADLRRRMLRMMRGHGAAVLFEGEPGMGRSRLLDRSALEGQVVGALPLRVDAGHGRGGDYQLMRSITHELLQLQPEAVLESAAPWGPLLGHVLPALWERLGKPPLATFRTRTERRPALQRALREWILHLADRRALVIAVDDIHLGDEPSLSVLALLSRVAGNHRILLAASAPARQADESLAALAVLRESCGVVRLSPLRDAETQSMLESVFGAAEAITTLAEQLHVLSEGNPGTCMALAEHLVERGLLRHERGGWVAPAQIDESVLPRDLADAAARQITLLTDDALYLAQALHLAHGQLFLADYPAVTAHGDLKRLYAALDELLARDVLTGSGHGYSFRHATTASALRASTSEERRRDIELRLSQVLRARAAHPLVVAHHLLAAARDEEAISVLLAFDQDMQTNGISVEPSALPYLQSSLEGALAASERLGKPEQVELTLRVALVGWAMFIDPALASRHAERIELALRRATGLLHFGSLDASLTQAARLTLCLERAERAWNAADPEHRGPHPLAAIEILGRYVLYALAPAGTMFDVAWLRQLCALVEPFALLAPALEVIFDVANATCDIAQTRNKRAEEGFSRVLRRLAEPDGAGIPEYVRPHLRLAVLYALAQSCASRTEPMFFRFFEELDAEPMHRVNALRVQRQMHLLRAETVEAQACKAQIESAMLENGGLRTLDGGTAYTDMRIAVLCGDAAELKRSIQVLGVLRERYPRYAAFELCARGVHNALCGDLLGAKQDLERSLGQLQAETDGAWATVTDDYLALRYELDGAETVAPLAEQALRKALALALDARQTTRLSALLACCEAELGELPRAAARIRAAIDLAKAEGHAPVQAAEIYLRGARTALAVKDEVLFEECARAYAAICKRSGLPALAARYDALMEAAHGSELPLSDLLEEFARDTTQKLGGKRLRAEMRRRLSECESPHERAHSALALLVARTRASRGFLYAADGENVKLAAQTGDEPTSAELDATVQEHWRSLREQAEGSGSRTQETEPSTTRSGQAQAGEYRLTVLRQRRNGATVVTGIAALCAAPGDTLHSARDAVQALEAELAPGDLLVASTERL